MTPLALRAIDLYRKRSAADSGANGFIDGAVDGPLTEATMARRLRELEASDLEQARLLSELTKQVEALAQTVAQEMEAGRRRDARTRVLIGGCGLIAILALGVAGWMAW